MIRGDFNDIRDQEEKKGGRRRQDCSFWGFRNFIADMEMGEVKFRGDFLLELTTEKMKALSKKCWIYFLDQLNG